jgi:2-keto-4-pentenoate hydratase
MYYSKHFNKLPTTIFNNTKPSLLSSLLTIISKKLLSTATTTPIHLKIGESLALARLSRERLGQDKTSHLLPSYSPDLLTSLTDAYPTALACHSTLVEKGGWNLSGYKIGATSEIVQQRIGLNTPFWGRLYNQSIEKRLTQHQKTHRFSIREDLIRGVEAEFAFVLKKEINSTTITGCGAGGLTPLQLVQEYISHVIPSVEICASRLPLNAKPTAQALIADSGGNGSVILGNESTSSIITIDEKTNVQSLLDLLEVSTAQISIDGEIVASGAGKNVLGNPLNSLAWFVNNMVGTNHTNNSESSLTLYPSQTIITGATCGLIPITKPCYVKVSFPDWRGGW